MRMSRPSEPENCGVVISCKGLVLSRLMIVLSVVRFWLSAARPMLTDACKSGRRSLVGSEGSESRPSTWPVTLSGPIGRGYG